jgi:hypothetical protein
VPKHYLRKRAKPGEKVEDDEEMEDGPNKPTFYSLAEVWLL